METATQTTFDIFKKDFLLKAKEADACSEQYKKAAKCENETDFLAVIKDNFIWCHENIEAFENILTGFYNEENLNASGIYFSGYHEVHNGFFYAWGNATVEASGNATVRAWGNATVEAWGNATVEASGNATVRASDNANLLIYYNPEKHKLEGRATMKVYGERKLYVKKGEFEIVEV